MRAIPGSKGYLPPKAVHNSHQINNNRIQTASHRRQSSLLPQSHAFSPLKLDINHGRSLQRRTRATRLSPQASAFAQALHVIVDTPVRDALAVGGSVIGARVLVGIFEYLEEIGAVDKVN